MDAPAPMAHARPEAPRRSTRRRVSFRRASPWPSWPSPPSPQLYTSPPAVRSKVWNAPAETARRGTPASASIGRGASCRVSSMPSPRPSRPLPPYPHEKANPGAPVSSSVWQWPAAAAKTVGAPGGGRASPPGAIPTRVGGSRSGGGRRRKARQHDLRRREPIALVAVPQPSEPAVTPRVHGAALGDGNGVVLAGGEGTDAHVAERRDHRRHLQPLDALAVPEQPGAAAVERRVAAREERAVAAHKGGVVHAACDDGALGGAAARPAQHCPRLAVGGSDGTRWPLAAARWRPPPPRLAAAAAAAARCRAVKCAADAVGAANVLDRRQPGHHTREHVIW